MTDLLAQSSPLAGHLGWTMQCLTTIEALGVECWRSALLRSRSRQTYVYVMLLYILYIVLNAILANLESQWGPWRGIREWKMQCSATIEAPGCRSGDSAPLKNKIGQPFV